MPEFILPTLFSAIRRGDRELLQLLLKKRPGLALKRDERGTTALMLAASMRRIECVKALIPLSDPVAIDRYGCSALIAAATEGCVECVKALIPVSDPLVRDKEGRSALMMVVLIRGHDDCLQALLPVSDARATANDGMTALMGAAFD